MFGWIFRIHRLRQIYGYELFHWVMPYAEQKGFSVILEKK